MQQIPSIGRQIHYVLGNGQHRAATVVNCWGGTAVNLTVHLDQMNDFENAPVGDQTPGREMSAAYAELHARDSGRPRVKRVKPSLIPQGSSDLQNGTLAVGSAANDEEGKAPGTWHWPEMVKPPEAADPYKYTDRQKNGA